MHLKTKHCLPNNKINNNLNKVKKQQSDYRQKLATSKPAQENVKSWLKSIVDMQNNVTPQALKKQQSRNSTTTSDEKNEAKHAINYNDLPYMGEITLDNSRPRRGRKPKKANICHLIYKNYGTIILGEPEISACQNSVCNKRCLCKINHNEPQMETQSKSTAKVQNLPLNLCLRDQHDQELQQKQPQQPRKNQDNSNHKRSTSFIPQKTGEAGSSIISPSVEVSIGKFKFTGGVNPLLQKKRMLSVDSVGNYIYFDGNDNKMLQPEEAQQEQKSAPQKQKAIETLKYTTFPKCLNKFSESSRVYCTKPNKRITHRSEQRERLEKSFKEQGFLIQTQQMQSSEGATYCKFRQLKKFTRYLFRNWKDYLPNELQQQQQQKQLEEQKKSTNNLTSLIFNKTENNTQNAK